MVPSGWHLGWWALWCHDGGIGCRQDSGRWGVDIVVAIWWRYGGDMVAFLRPAFLPPNLARYFRVGEGHMWENPKLFWARACMGGNF